DLGFDRRGAEVLAAADDDVGRSTDDSEVAVRVDLTDVADAHPAVVREQSVVGGRVVEVAEARRRTATDGIAGHTGGRDVAAGLVEQPPAHRGVALPRGAEAVFAVVPHGRAAGRAGLVRAVELQHARAGHLFEPRGALARHGLAACEHATQRSQVALLEL